MFLLDANAFIEANRLYYGFDIAPGFWQWLEAASVAAQVGSVPAVKDEITAGTGPLVSWAKGLPTAFWLAETAGTVAAMTHLSGWASDTARPYGSAAVNEFLGSADLRLVAHASVIGATVVTREKPAPESKTSVKIPEACDAAGVLWTDPFAAYRSLGLRLIV